MTNLIGRQASGEYKLGWPQCGTRHVVGTTEIVAVTQDQHGDLLLWVLDEGGTPRELVGNTARVYPRDYPGELR